MARRWRPTRRWTVSACATSASRSATGYVLNNFSDDAFSLLDQTFSLRDSEQLLVKLSYRFER